MSLNRLTSAALVFAALFLSGCGGGTSLPAATAVGFDTPEQANEACWEAVKNRDIQAYRNLIAKQPSSLEHFDKFVAELIKDEGDEAKGKASAVEVQETFRFKCRVEGKRAKQYPAIIDGDRAAIYTAYINWRKELAHDLGTFKKIDGKWYVWSFDGTPDGEWAAKPLDDAHEKMPAAPES